MERNVEDLQGDRVWVMEGTEDVPLMVSTDERTKKIFSRDPIVHNQEMVRGYKVT